MFTNINKLLISAACVAVVACGGGGGGGGGSAETAAPVESVYTQKINDFVTQLNASGEFNVNIVKSHQGGHYIVVEDSLTREYNAYYVNYFNLGDDAMAHFEANERYNFYDLDLIPGHNESHQEIWWGDGCECDITSTVTEWIPTAYRDRYTGKVFEKVGGTPKDRLKMAAIEEQLNVARSAEHLSAEFGLSAERSHEVAKLIHLWKVSPKERMTNADHDRFAAAVLGHTFGEYESAVQNVFSGDKSQLDRLIADAAAINGLTAEDANSIALKIFAGQL